MRAMTSRRGGLFALRSGCFIAATTLALAASAEEPEPGPTPAASPSTVPARVTQPPERAPSWVPIAARSSEIAGVAFSGLMAGFFVSDQLGPGPWKNAASAETYVDFEHSLNGPYGAYTPTLMIGTAVSNVATMLLLRNTRHPSFWLAAVSLVGVATSVVTTLTLNAPVNRAVDRWAESGAIPADWTESRSKWQTGHDIRTAISVGVFALNISTMLF